MSRRFGFLVSATLIFAPIASAQPAKSPLRFVPAEAEWVVQLDHPRTLVDAVEKHDLFLKAQKLTGIRELYETTNAQQLYQLIEYFEKKLGKDRSALLEELTAGGAVLAARLTPPKGAALILQSRDEARLRAFVDLTLDILTKELERQESKDKIVRKKYERFDVGQIGPKLSFAIADGALVLASDAHALKMVLDTDLQKHSSLAQTPNFRDARKQAPAKALAWTWLNLEEVRKNQGFRDGLNAASLDPLQVLLFGGLTDLLKRAPHLSAALTQESGKGYRVAIRMPRGREGMSAISHMILPPDDKGSLPPLLPPRVISSSSYFLDLGQFWDKRRVILGETNAKGLEEGDKNLAKVLGGITLAKLFHSAGPRQRLVFAQQKDLPYKIKPATPFPAFALVLDTRDPSFAREMNSIFRSAALLGTFAFGLQLKEETYKGCDIVSYRFSETKKVEGDPQNVRFNFTPSYVAVGDQFVISGTAELARDLVDAIQAQSRSSASKATMRTQLFATGLGDIIRSNQDATLTQLILSQALPPQSARAEVRAILDWLDAFGALEFEIHYGEADFRYDIQWRPRTK